MKIQFLAGLMVVTLGVFATPTHAENLLQVYQQARGYDARIQSRESGHLAVQEKRQQAQASFKPQIKLSANASHSLQYDSISNNTLNGNATDYAVKLGMPLYSKPCGSTCPRNCSYPTIGYCAGTIAGTDGWVLPAVGCTRANMPLTVPFPNNIETWVQVAKQKNHQLRADKQAVWVAQKGIEVAVLPPKSVKPSSMPSKRNSNMTCKTDKLNNRHGLLSYQYNPVLAKPVQTNKP